MSLVIVESPAKCSKIQGFLGAGYKVIASMGHIRALKDKLEAIGLERDFEPYYEWIDEKKRAIEGIRAAARGCKQVYLAADDDREGEAIAYSVCLLLGLPVETTPRAVFHEITKKAVCAAVAAPRRLDLNKIHAQQSRAVLDMMIGFTMSPLLWKHVGSGLSAGRCQTPGLRLLVEREDSIAAFTATSSWGMKGTWGKGLQGALKDELDDEESARNYLEILADVRTATIKHVEIKGWTAAPPQPFTTSSLQQAASSHYKMAPKMTMSTAQKLYEGGHITYMRTDSTALSEDAVNEIRRCIEAAYGEEYVGGGTKKKKVAGAQEAHEAIRPTHIEVAELEGDEWTAAHRKLYGLIRTRTLQSQMAAARGEECIVEWLPDDTAIEDFIWAAAVRRTTFDGWRRLGRTENIMDSDEDSAENQWSDMAALKVGDSLTWTRIVAEPRESKPAGRYTEATLVRELEKRGIGRPSTFASIIASLTDKKYVEEKDIVGREVSITTLTLERGRITETTKKKMVGGEKKKMVPTELGRRALGYLLKEFGDLFDYGFTAAMEARLDNIAQGREEWKGVLRDTWAAYKDRYERAGTGTGTGGNGMQLGGGLKAILTKRGPMLLREDPTGDKKKTKFYGWPEGVELKDMTAEIAARHIAVASSASSASICEYEGVAVYKKKGPYGWYVQCGDRRVKCDETDDAAAIMKKLGSEPVGAKGVLRKIGDFEIREGQYGKYMFKPGLKTKVFVKVADSCPWATWTVADAKAHYDEAKKRK